jgi:hypothetical protein
VLNPAPVPMTILNLLVIDHFRPLISFNSIHFHITKIFSTAKKGFSIPYFLPIPRIPEIPNSTIDKYIIHILDIPTVLQGKQFDSFIHSWYDDLTCS